MKIPSATDKPKNVIDILSNNADAVKVSTGKGKSSAESQGYQRAAAESALNAEKASSVKLGLAKYLSEELDPKKISEARQAKIDQIKARIEAGTYLSSIKSENLAEKILEEINIEILADETNP